MARPGAAVGVGTVKDVETIPSDLAAYGISGQ